MSSRDQHGNNMKIEIEVLSPNFIPCDLGGVGVGDSEGNSLLYNNKLLYVLYNTQVIVAITPS